MSASLLSVTPREGVKDAGFRIRKRDSHTAVLVYEGKDPSVGDLDDPTPAPSIKIPPYGLKKSTGPRRNTVEHTIHINTNLCLSVAPGHIAAITLADKFVRQDIQLIGSTAVTPDSPGFVLIVKNSVAGNGLTPQQIDAHTVTIDPGDTVASITVCPSVPIYPSDDDDDAVAA